MMNFNRYFHYEFNDKYEVIKNIQSKKVDISNNQWIAMM